MKSGRDVICSLPFLYGIGHQIYKGLKHVSATSQSGIQFQPFEWNHSFLSLMEEGAIAGAIIFGGSIAKRSQILGSFPVINTSRYYQETTLPIVGNDDWLAGCRATESLLMTKPSFVIILSDLVGDHQRDRRNGAIAVLQEAGVPFRSIPVRHGGAGNYLQRKMIVDRLLNEDYGQIFSVPESMPIGIVCTELYSAELAVVKAIQEGYDVPAQVRVIGIGSPDDRLSLVGQSGVSHVPLNWEKVGEQAALSIIHWIQEGTPPAPQQLIPPLEPVILSSSRLYEESIVERTKSLIVERKDYGMTLEQIAAEFGISVGTLVNRFKRESSMGPKETLLNWRMQEAKRLLLETRLDIAGIAARCGYADHSTFSAAFRKQVGQPPSRWRNQA